MSTTTKHLHAQLAALHQECDQLRRTTEFVTLEVKPDAVWAHFASAGHHFSMNLSEHPIGKTFARNYREAVKQYFVPC